MLSSPVEKGASSQVAFELEVSTKEAVINRVGQIIAPGRGRSRLGLERPGGSPLPSMARHPQIDVSGRVGRRPVVSFSLPKVLRGQASTDGRSQPASAGRSAMGIAARASAVSLTTVIVAMAAAVLSGCGPQAATDAEREESIRLPTGQSGLHRQPRRPLDVVGPAAVVKLQVEADNSWRTDTVRSVADRLRPGKTEKLSKLFHSLLVYGPDATVPTVISSAVETADRRTEDKASVRILDVILDAEAAAKYWGPSEERVVAPTPYGLRFPLYYERTMSLGEFNTEAHQGQGLSILASLGLSTDVGIRFRAEGGYERKTIRHLLEDTTANFSLAEEEVYWDAVSLALYLPPQRSWEDKFGQRTSFDDLANELVNRPNSDSSCAGTHKLYALAVLAESDRRSPILSPVARSAVDSELRRAVEQLVRVQLPEGGWTTEWFQSDKDRREAESETPLLSPTIHTELLATGHHLEWLLLLPEDAQPDRERIERAADRCLRLLSQITTDKAAVEEHYCPIVHAYRTALLVFGRPKPSRAVPVASTERTTDVRSF